ncbi:MAG TPA: zinc metallopeptidase [Candidatus Coprenecus stercoripullorum]|nr:zinc metallopeptidase [Candidatus Coprenecus stercoripullorum]
MNVGIFLFIIIAIAGMIVQARLDSVFRKYSKVTFPGFLTGKDVAEKMLRDNGIRDVQVTSVRGRLTDHYNPVKKTLNLSESVYGSTSVAAAAVAAHECGHAVQHAEGYAWLKMRSALVPIVNFSSMFAQIVLVIGIFLLNIFPPLFWIGIGMFAMVLLFSIITLPVEYNASRRALVWLQASNTLRPAELEQAKETLTWAARTYLVAALSALATLIYYLGFARRD